MRVFSVERSDRGDGVNERVTVRRDVEQLDGRGVPEAEEKGFDG